MATVKFYVQGSRNPASIHLRFSIRRGLEPSRSTGLKIDPHKWDDKKQEPIARDEYTKSLGVKLLSLKSSILQQYYAVQDDKETDINGTWLKGAIDKHFGRVEPENLDYLINYAQYFVDNLPQRKLKTGKRPTVGTAKKYATILSKLREFEQYRKKRIQLKSVDLKLRAELVKYLSEVDGLSDNTIGRYIKFVKTFVLDARKNAHEVNPRIDDWKGFTAKVDKVTLSFEELDLLQSVRFENERLEAAKDWLLIGCYTGQRVSDLLRMNQSMLDQIQGFQLICLEQVKTGKRVNIPMHPVVKSILDKRNGQFPPSFGSTSASASAIFNRLLKTVCKQAGICKVVEGNLFDESTKRTVSGKFPKFKLVSSHICRRSFATNFYANPKYPTPLLMNITGHTTEKQFLEYIGKEPTELSIQLAKTWAQESLASKKEPQLTVIKSAANQ